MSSANSSRRVSKSISTSRLSLASSSTASRRQSKPSSRRTSSMERSRRSRPDSSWEWLEDTADGPGYYPLTKSNSTGFLPQIGCFALTGIPGYTGYVPRKSPENVFGATFRRANELSLYRDPREIGYQCLGYNPGGLGGRLGDNVPGYGGYIPGKYSDNVFGKVFAEANKIAQAIKVHQALDRDEAHQRQIDEWQQEGGKIMGAWQDSQHGRYHHIKNAQKEMMHG
ncbi:hypothetical protein FOL47_004534 [Perkinsus chesapeaki]|uniref:Uncharacterized protein n=1 Tax=Perkinsus chesapeaki TaxID=330153 RepID=A0A7J6M2V0_PERCH|nr:hypothetical protein FOL47_004534 [Perkinsus chesapeaki]